MEASLLRFYSLAIVAQNKDISGENIKKIEAVPIERSSFVDGELTADIDKVKASATTSKGAAYEMEIDASRALPATWIPFGADNRVTAPDVRRGEEVLLWQFGDAPELFWTTVVDNLNLRKLETVIWAFSATKDEKKGFDPENCYFLEISTHRKLVTFHTSQADGEPFGFDIQINTEEGLLTVRDTNDNSLDWDAREKSIRITNGDGSYIDVNKKKIDIYASEQVRIRTSSLIEEVDTKKLTAQSIEVEADERSVKAETTHTGNIMEVGNLTVAGKMKGIPGAGGGGGEGEFSGSIKTSQTLEAEGDIKTSSTVRANKVISSTDIEAPNV